MNCKFIVIGVWYIAKWLHSRYLFFLIIIFFQVPAGLTLFPKSKSSNSFIGITKTSNNYQQDHRISDRYQYRSSALPTCEEELLSSGELQLIEEEIIKSAIPDSNVVEKFIKVIEGNPTNPAAGPAGLKKTAFKSREEIRKKLAFGGTDSSGAGSNFSTGYV